MSKILSAGLVAGVSGRRMQRLAVLVVLLVSALTFTGGASAALRIGVADDLGRYPDQSVWFLDSLGELGMSENRITVNFDPAAPTTIPDQWQLDLYVPLATLRGVRPVFRSPPPRRRRSPRIPTQRSSTLSTSRSLPADIPPSTTSSSATSPTSRASGSRSSGARGEMSPPARTTGCSLRPTTPSRLSTPRSE